MEKCFLCTTGDIQNCSKATSTYLLQILGLPQSVGVKNFDNIGFCLSCSAKILGVHSTCDEIRMQFKLNSRQQSGENPTDLANFGIQMVEELSSASDQSVLQGIDEEKGVQRPQEQQRESSAVYDHRRFLQLEQEVAGYDRRILQLEQELAELRTERRGGGQQGLPGFPQGFRDIPTFSTSSDHRAFGATTDVTTTGIQNFNGTVFSVNATIPKTEHWMRVALAALDGGSAARREREQAHFMDETHRFCRSSRYQEAPCSHRPQHQQHQHQQQQRQHHQQHQQQQHEQQQGVHSEVLPTFYVDGRRRSLGAGIEMGATGIQNFGGNVITINIQSQSSDPLSEGLERVALAAVAIAEGLAGAHPRQQRQQQGVPQGASFSVDGNRYSCGATTDMGATGIQNNGGNVITVNINSSDSLSGAMERVASAAFELGVGTGD